jgi:predicted O-linked N-acetylglucosamine transferase (SPINDLY family)
MRLTLQDAFALAERHEVAGRTPEARRIYDEILAQYPDHPGALLKIALHEMAAGAHDAARKRLRRALASARRDNLSLQDIWLALARAEQGAGDPVAARRAVSEAHEIAKRLKAAGALAGAHALLAQCVELAPAEGALRITLGAILLDANRPAEAAEQIERAIALGHHGAEASDNLGIARRMQGREEEALAAFERAVAANPALTPALANLVNTRYALCEWDGLEAHEQRLLATLSAPSSDPRWPPWIALSIPTSSAQQLEIGRRWAQAMLPAVAPRRKPLPRAGRLRVGYLSGNFRDHPTARQMVGLFEHHDRSRFEVTGYGYGSEGGGAIGERVRSAFERWRDVRELSDAEVARQIRDDRIDILVDRHGYTLGGRLGILASRPAAVQVHYMSFPGTLGFDAIDEVIADAEVIPSAEERFFHERVRRLPRCYYVNDDRRGVPAATPRAAHGLPENAVVLACLNQSHKLRRPTFAHWLTALRARSDAVLWLLAGPEKMQRNLRAEAERAGVAPQRLIFADRVAQDAHIARLPCADLALDTLPYGSHTTGCDALWMGVPMLTCRGSTFAGRVGASLLDSAGLPELIAESLESYGERLLELVTNPARLADYSHHLRTTRERNPLFDTAGFARDWESLLLQIYDEAASDPSPQAAS